MPTSLKAFIPTLAPIVSMTKFALYERQRVLVAAGLLKAEPGRGEGTGVRCTPESVAMLLVGILATDDLSDTAEATKKIARLKIDKPCKLTGKTRFIDAVAEILRSKISATIGVARHEQTAIVFNSVDGMTHFGKALPKGGVEIQANLVPGMMAAIVEAMKGGAKRGEQSSDAASHLGASNSICLERTAGGNTMLKPSAALASRLRQRWQSALTSSAKVAM